MKDKFLNDCINLLQKDEIKNNIKDVLNPLLQPIISNVLKDIYPYIYLSLVFVFVSFILHLGIFIILVKNKINLKS